MPNKDTLQSRWTRADQQRQVILNAARVAAALSKPWVLPPKDQSPNAPLPENYQSLGSRGITNLVGRMLMALFPPSVPWFQLELSPEIKYDASVPDADKEAFSQQLFLQELQIQAVLESAYVTEQDKNNRNRRHVGFRSRKRNTLDQSLITGDVLEQMTDDYRIKVFRRDQYVTKRDSASDVLYHIVREKIDPLALDNGLIEKAGLNAGELEGKDVEERMLDLYTEVAWHPTTRKWVIRQEINEKGIVESEETVSPFFATPFELAPGEDYGRGFIELNLGDLRSLNELEEKILDFAAMASKLAPVLDAGSSIRPKDLMKPSGEVITGGRVRGGRVEDVALLTIDKVSDFRVVYQTAERKTKDLSAAMLLESEMQPRGERVTATQVQRIAMELEGTLGGLYAPIADDQQVPLLQRTVHQLRRDGLLPTLPDEAVRIEALTGIAALSREANAGRVMQLTQVVGQLGPEALSRIDMGILVNVLARYSSIYEPGLIKSNEQMQAEAEAAQQQAVEQQATGKAIDTAGNVAEKVITEGE